MLSSQYELERRLFLEAFGARLRGLRLRRRLSLRTVARRTGLSVSKLEAVEAGNVDPRLDDLVKLAAALRVTTAQLVAVRGR